MDPYANLAADDTDNVVYLSRDQKNDNNFTFDPEPFFEEKDLQVFCKARHEALCYKDNVNVLSCGRCKSEFSPIDLVDNTFQSKMTSYDMVSIPLEGFVSNFRTFSLS
jgi:hypothetical protein